MRLDKPEATARKRGRADERTGGARSPARAGGARAGGAPGQVSGRAATEAAAVRYPFRFTGSGGEYFRIWLVNVLLSIVTLYVYSAWAKVRTNRYFHGNTVLDGSSFEYHARPPADPARAHRRGAAVRQRRPSAARSARSSRSARRSCCFSCCRGRCGRSTMFNARMTSYRNVRFGFTGGVGRDVSLHAGAAVPAARPRDRPGDAARRRVRGEGVGDRPPRRGPA